MSFARTSPGKIRNSATSMTGKAFSVAPMPPRDALLGSGYPQRLFPCGTWPSGKVADVAAKARGGRGQQNPANLRN